MKKSLSGSRFNIKTSMHLLISLLIRNEKASIIFIIQNLTILFVLKLSHDGILRTVYKKIDHLEEMLWNLKLFFRRSKIFHWWFLISNLLRKISFTLHPNITNCFNLALHQDILFKLIFANEKFLSKIRKIVNFQHCTVKFKIMSWHRWRYEICMTWICPGTRLAIHRF